MHVHFFLRFCPVERLVAVEVEAVFTGAAFIALVAQKASGQVLLSGRTVLPWHKTKDTKF
jgi:hypothetical protein